MIGTVKLETGSLPSVFLSLEIAQNGFTKWAIGSVRRGRKEQPGPFRSSLSENYASTEFPNLLSLLA